MTYLLPLMKHDWLLTKRNLVSFIFAMGLPVFFFLFFSQGVGNSSAEQLVLRHYLMSMTAFSSLSLCFYTFPFSLQEDRNNNRLRLLKHTPVPQWLYYFSKMLRIVLFYACAIILNFLVGSFVRGVKLPMTDWVMSALMLLFAMVTFLPYGLLLTQIKSDEIMSTTANAAYIVLAMLGGMWMPLNTFPNWLQTIGKCTPTYHFHHMVTSYLENGTIINNSLLVLLGYSAITIVFVCWLESRREFGDR